MLEQQRQTTQSLGIAGVEAQAENGHNAQMVPPVVETSTSSSAQTNLNEALQTEEWKPDEHILNLLDNWQSEAKMVQGPVQPLVVYDRTALEDDRTLQGQDQELLMQPEQQPEFKYLEGEFFQMRQQLAQQPTLLQLREEWGKRLQPVIQHQKNQEKEGLQQLNKGWEDQLSPAVRLHRALQYLGPQWEDQLSSEVQHEVKKQNLKWQKLVLDHSLQMLPLRYLTVEQWLLYKHQLEQELAPRLLPEEQYKIEQQEEERKNLHEKHELLMQKLGRHRQELQLQQEQLGEKSL